MNRPYREVPDFGTTKLQFDIDGHGAYILLPTNGAERAHWAWYAPSFIDKLPKPRHMWYISRLLARGLCVCGVDVGESWGNPDGRAIYTKFYDACVEDFRLDHKPCLWCQSRGGLMHYNWAAEHPQRVRCVGGVYPVVDGSSPVLQERVARAYGMPEPAFLKVLEENNPVDRLAPLAEHGVPLFHVHGDADTVVPLDRNSGELVKRYEALGGAASLKIIPDKGHEEVSEFFECPELIAFFLEHTGLTGPSTTS